VHGADALVACRPARSPIPPSDLTRDWARALPCIKLRGDAAAGDAIEQVMAGL